MPDRDFGHAQASMSAEELAVASLSVPPSDENAKGTSLAPQGSMFNLRTKYNNNYNGYYDQDGVYRQDSNCPAEGLREDFCSLGSTCVAQALPMPEDSPSINSLVGYLIALTAFYMLAAAYWAQVFPGNNGVPRRFYFFLLPSYWLPAKSSVRTGVPAFDVEDQQQRDHGIVVENVKKVYGDFEALKGVSLTMDRNEVTAFLGHNGAGNVVVSHLQKL